MKVGYTTDPVAAINLREVCQEVQLIKSEESNAARFLDFISKNEEHEIVIFSLVDLNLQLIQLLPGLRLLHEQEKTIHLMEQDVLGAVSDEIATSALYQMAVMEEEIMRSRTMEGIENARKKGLIAGRPKINERVVEKIRSLYGGRQKTIREIADICGVSVGTAYKYATQAEKE